MNSFHETRMKGVGPKEGNLTPTDAEEVIQEALQLSLMRLVPTLGGLLYTSDLVCGR